MDNRLLRDRLNWQIEANRETGRIGYVVLWFMGVPIGVLLLMWVILGNYIFGPG